MSDSETERLSNDLHSTKEATRLAAARAITERRLPTAVDELVQALSDPSKAVQEAARDALVSIGGREVVKRLSPLLEDEDVARRMLAVEVLAKVGLDAPELLLKVFKSGSDDARIFALNIFARLGSVPTLDALASQLQSKNANVRNAAVICLGAIATPEVVPYLFKALDDDEWVRFSAIEGLANCGGESAVQAIREKLSESRDGPYYAGVLESFVQIRRPEIVAPLFDELAEVGDTYATDIVGALVELEEFEDAFRSVSDAMRQRLRPALEAEVGSEDPWAAFRAFTLIGRLGDRHFLGSAISALSSPNELIRAGAMHCLSEIGVAGDLEEIERTFGLEKLEASEEGTKLVETLRGRVEE